MQEPPPSIAVANRSWMVSAVLISGPLALALFGCYALIKSFLATGVAMLAFAVVFGAINGLVIWSRRPRRQPEGSKEHRRALWMERAVRVGPIAVLMPFLIVGVLLVPFAVLGLALWIVGWRF